MELTLDIVKAARELIADRAHWVKGVYAARSKNKFDRTIEEIDLTDENAVCFCGLGAIRRAAYKAMVSSSQAEEAFVREVVGCVPAEFRREYARFALFNDAPATTHADVLGAFDCLIAKMEAADAQVA